MPLNPIIPSEAEASLLPLNPSRVGASLFVNEKKDSISLATILPQKISFIPFKLIERLGTIPPTLMPYMEVIPLDSSYATDDDSISTIIRSQPDYVNVLDPYIFLHSAMKNDFYRNLMTAYTQEYQNVIDLVNSLKTYWDIDYYDGDQTAFLAKIEVLLELLSSSAPLFFVPFVNVENGNTIDLTKQNDFLRNLVKRVWLRRRWAGSLNGYNILFRLMNRLGAVHLGATYVSQTINLYTNKIFRFLDKTQFSLVLPNISGSAFPNTTQIEGLKSFSLVKPGLIQYDTGLIYDQSNLAYDQFQTYSISGKSLLLEITLDRLLTYTNTINTNLCLLDNIFLDTLKSMLTDIQRVTDVVYVGSQMSLITSKDGYFNTLSQAPYSHPNIKAKFQVFYYKPDHVTPNWTSVSNVSYIKIGTGGFGDSYVDNNVFVDTFGGSTPAGKSVLSDLRNPIFETVVGTQEKDTYGGFGIVNTVVHPREITNGTAQNTITINGAPTLPNYTQNTYIQTVHRYLSSGSVSMGVNIDYNIPGIQPVLGTIPAGKVTFSPVTASGETTYQFTVTAVVNSPSGTLLINGVNPNYTIATITLNGSQSTPAQVAALIVAAFPISSSNSTGWSAYLSGATVTFVSKTLPVHQRIFVNEVYNSFKNQFDPAYTFQQKTTSGDYAPFTSDTILYGYTSDALYGSSATSYFPTIDQQALKLLPLTIEDQYPSLANGLLGKYTLDDRVPVLTHSTPVNLSTPNHLVEKKQSAALAAFVYKLTDFSGNSNDGSFTNVAITTGMPIDTNNDLNYTMSFSGGTSYALIPSTVVLQNLVQKTVAFSFSSGGANTNNALLAKTDGSTGGWGIYFTDGGAFQGTLSYVNYNTSTPGTWTAPISWQTAGQFVRVALSYDNTNSPLVPTLYLNGVYTPMTMAQVPVGITGSDAAFSLTVGGLVGSRWFTGKVCELRLYNRILLAREMAYDYLAVINRKTPLLDSTGNQEYVYIDHINGQVVMKLVYNSNGPLATTWQSLSASPTSLAITTSQTYNLSISKNNVAVTEMGLFDANENMLAYATFPPVIYNATNYHIAFNLLVQL